MESREQAITMMCYSFRSDYAIRKETTDPPWFPGLTDFERRGLRRTMAEIYDNNIAPHTEKKHESRTKRKSRKM